MQYEEMLKTFMMTLEVTRDKIAGTYRRQWYSVSAVSNYYVATVNGEDHEDNNKWRNDSGFTPSNI